LKHVLSVEGDSWLKPDCLTNVIDVYMNSYVSNTAGQAGGNKVSKPSASSVSHQGGKVGQDKPSTSIAGLNVNNRAVGSKPTQSWKCARFGHKANECKSNGKPLIKPTGSSTVTNNNSSSAAVHQAVLPVLVNATGEMSFCPGFSLQASG